MYLKIIVLFVITLLIAGCGEGKVSIDPGQYHPKIAIEGFLFPHKPVSRIYIWRNFPVDANLQRMNLALPNADAAITDLESGMSYSLVYNPDSAYFEYDGNDLIIEYEKSYRLDVTAVIDGKTLQASAVTTVPSAGLQVASVNYDSLAYRQRDGNGSVLNFNIEFDRSPGTDFYLAAILALDADPNTFVYDNPFSDEEPEDVAADLDDYRYNYTWILDTPTTAGRSNIELFWFDLWFYSCYDVIIFAADRNYRDFLITYSDVQEEDGNFHEPVFHIDGDGIGVFGSAVVDTVYFEVVR